MMLEDRQIVDGIFLPAHDLHFADHLRHHGNYQLAKLRAGLEVSPRRGVAVDVGAQVGLWTRILAVEFAKVYAIEPMPEHLACLELNTVGHGNVLILEAALGDLPGRLALRRVDGVATAEVCDPDDADVHVPAYRLDDLLIAGLDFLKIDCEGYEHLVVCGGEQTIRRDRPVVVIEQKRRRAARYGEPLAGVALLQSWGAEVKWRMAGDYCLAWSQGEK